jgi:general L-amino acid transport system permease protein
VLAVLPGPRQGYQLPLGANLNIRGLFLPRPMLGGAFTETIIALAVAIIAVGILAAFARRRRNATGQPFPTFRIAFAVIVLLPLLTFLATGAPLSFDYPHLKGFNFVGGVQVKPEIMALILGLVLYTATFIAEVVRAGILDVDRGPGEAAAPVGLRRGQTLRLIVIPQALRVMIPPLTNQYLNLTKNSSLAVAVGYPDLVSIFAGTVLNQTGQAIEAVSITMLVYLVISLLTSLAMNRFNRRFSLVER